MRLVPVAVSLALVACSSGSGAPESTAAVTSAGVGSGGDLFTVTSYGSGEVPIGATCAPGDESVTLDFALMTIALSRCEGSPLRVASYQGIVTQADRDAFNQALRTSTDTTANPCVDVAAPLYRLTAWQGGGKLGAWVSACDNLASTRRADGLANVFMTARARGTGIAATPLPPPTMLGAGQSLWSVDPTSLKLDLFSHGNVPVGSDCIPGAIEYVMLADDLGANFQLGITKCIVQPSGVARATTDVHVYALGQLDGVFDALGRPAFGGAGCVAADPQQLRISHRGAGLTEFASNESRCSPLDEPFEPLFDISFIAAALDAL